MEAPNPVLGFRDGLPEELMSKPRLEKKIVVRPAKGALRDNPISSHEKACPQGALELLQAALTGG